VLIFREPRHKSIVAPDGKPAVLVTCTDREDCRAESRRACPGGYDVVSKDGRSWEVTQVKASKYRLFEGVRKVERYEGEWVVRCK